MSVETAWEDSGIRDRRRDGATADGPVSWVRFDWRKESHADYVVPLTFLAVWFGVGLGHLRALVTPPYAGWW